MLWDKTSEEEIKHVLRVLSLKKDYSFPMFAYQAGLNPKVFKADQFSGGRLYASLLGVGLVLFSPVIDGLFNARILALLIAILGFVLVAFASTLPGEMESYYRNTLEGKIGSFIRGESEDLGGLILSIQDFQNKSERFDVVQVLSLAD